ncbi:MAG: UDP-N-acetylmuramate--L-alanine ligase [Gemmatimonadales bacterium]
MTLFRTGDPRPIHLMGVGGAGMSALASIARHRGVAITGCDSDTSGAGTTDLTALGVRVWRGHDPSHLEGARAVVVTAAVPTDHPELVRARSLGLPVVRRADALGELVAAGGASVVAVAGTHGKTTTTVMITEALTAAGRNPTGLAGGRVAGWGGNARIGGADLYVVEADEYDKAFLSLRPRIAVVNNVEADHLECYGSVEALEAAFAEFAGRAERVIVGADDAGADRVALQLETPIWRVGLGPTADVRIRGVRLEPGGSRATISLPGGHTIELQLAVPGLHNVRNAAVALGALQALGADVQQGAAALSEFHGVGRRFERLGEAGGVTVVDDYAHHPTEVAATLAAARQAFPGRRLIAVFQPHLYSRTALHGEALGKALAAADMAIVAPIYGAREEPVSGVTHHLVVRGATRAGAATVSVRDRAGLTQHVARAVREGDVVFTLGAGDITKVGPELLEILTAGSTKQGAVA